MNKKFTRKTYGIVGAAIIGLLALFFGHDLVGLGVPYEHDLLYALVGGFLGFGLGYLIGCVLTMGIRPRDYAGKSPEPSEPPNPWEGMEPQRCQTCGHVRWIQKEKP